MRIDGSTEARRRGDFASVDRLALTKSLQFRGDEVKNLFSGVDGQGGYIDGLLRGTRQALAIVNQSLGISGSVVDTFALSCRRMGSRRINPATKRFLQLVFGSFL